MICKHRRAHCLLRYPLTFVGEVKCNVPINAGEKYGTQPRNGIIADVETLITGKRKSPMITQGILKFMAFLGRVAN